MGYWQREMYRNSKVISGIITFNFKGFGKLFAFEDFKSDN